MRIRIFENRAFAVDNAVLFLLMIAFVPLFFFASMYAQISLGESASETGLYLLIFFAGFVDRGAVGRQDPRRSAARGRRSSLGCADRRGRLRPLGARSCPSLSVGSQWPYIVLAGAGVGLVLGPANTDALNRVPRSRYGEATGITQTVRNFGASLGLAVLGTVLILENKSNLEATLGAEGLPKAQADEIADALSESGGGEGERLRRARRRGAQKIFAAVQHDFALSSRTVFYGDGRRDGGRLRRRADLDAVAAKRRIWTPDGGGHWRYGAQSADALLSPPCVLPACPARVAVHDGRLTPA